MKVSATQILALGAVAIAGVVVFRGIDALKNAPRAIGEGFRDLLIQPRREARAGGEGGKESIAVFSQDRQEFVSE